MEISFYNSLSKKVEKFSPVLTDEVKMYSCGPTVYNYAHIGNMRAFLFADLLQRVLRTVGKYEVKWVMNITDIDDKTIRDSRIGSDAWLSEMGSQTESELDNLKVLTEFYQDAFLDDISKLGINLEHFFALPAATDFIEEMQDLIRKIIDNGFAYISGGSVYFDVSKWRTADTYGKLFKIDFDNFKSGVRIDADEYERENVSDFVLWKEKKENEPFWDFEINGLNLPGRPGWHIECSAMEYELLGLPFDIHTGGVDLKFPHHEDEIAQSKAGYGCEPTNYWLHNDFLEVEGEKMSKSAGNFFTVRDLLDKGIDPIDIRFAMLSAHYRTKLNFTFAGVDAQKKARRRIQEYIWQLADNNKFGELTANAEKLREDTFNELANDLHTPKALAHIFSFINNNDAEKLNLQSKSELLSFFEQLNSIFEAFSFEPKPDATSQIPDSIVNLAQERWDAKRSKDFAKADEIRKKLESEGWIIKDARDGYEIFTKE
ncbi:cysteine--tRNA ligase [Candidatus Kapaibacterium sp.]